ncbi:hypothetical protein [Pararhizobium sp. IMCC21322]|uniref:hypothetical protein n=1 Tax=Pararhizobium sp. IMCC21322 TaxID=3067903 RepID=UPI002740B752|nr:hypothetical protein [Pararhizobium sp. IMCC21322]
MYPHEEVKKSDYFRKALGNMVKHGGKLASIRFGLTGDGVAPNYMIIDPQNGKHPFHGNGHGPFKEAPGNQFADDRLAPAMSFTDVQQQIQRCISDSK